VEKAYAAKMDEWIVWEAGETRRMTSFFCAQVRFLSARGTHTPGLAHSARWGRKISYVRACTQGRRPVSFVLSSVFRVRDCKRDANQNQSAVTSASHANNYVVD
jgi:hypothetical protein